MIRQTVYGETRAAPKDESAGESFLRVAADTEDLMLCVADQLSLLATNLVMFCGPDSPAVRILWESADRLSKQQKELGNAVGRKCSDDLRVAQEATGNMMSAILAGVIHTTTGEADPC